MAQTQLTGKQIGDGTVQRADLDTTTAGSSLIRKIIAGLGFSATSTGVDAGTGDVTLNLKTAAVFGAATLTNNTVATTETVIAKWSIPANSLAALDNLDITINGQVSSTASLTYRIRFGTAGTSADALLATFTTTGGGAANAFAYLQGLISVLSSTTMTAAGFLNFLSGFIYPLNTAAFAAATVNLTVANFLTVTLVQSIAQTYTSRSAKLSV